MCSGHSRQGLSDASDLKNPGEQAERREERKEVNSACRFPSPSHVLADRTSHPWPVSPGHQNYLSQVPPSPPKPWHTGCQAPLAENVTPRSVRGLRLTFNPHTCKLLCLDCPSGVLTDQGGDFIRVPRPLMNQLTFSSQDAPLPRPLYPRPPSPSCSGAGLQEAGKARPSPFPPGLVSKARSFLLSEGRQEVALPPLVVHPGQLARGSGT